MFVDRAGPPGGRATRETPIEKGCGLVGRRDLFQGVRTLSVQAYRRSARWPIGSAKVGAYL
jgi:hypothetical protein